MNEFSEPTINKDDSNGVVSISGISMMEDAMDFYKPLKEWTDQYLNSNKALVIDFELNYFNSSSRMNKLIAYFIKYPIEFSSDFRFRTFVL